MEDFVDLPYYRKPLDFGLGKTLAEAAFNWGYWSKGDERFTCKECRTKDGEAHRKTVVAQSKKWGRNVFTRALTSISKGYVASEEFKFPADVLVINWLKMKLPTEKPTRSQLIRPSGPYLIDRLQINKIHKRHRPAKYRTEDLVGWSFPNTIWVPGTDHYGNTTTYPKEATILTVDGLLHSGKSDSKKRPRIDELRLIIEMARKYAQIKHLTWCGPGNGYDLRPRA